MYLAEFENSDIKPVLDHFGLTVRSARVGVYGTLRKNGGANQLLEGLEYDNSFILGGGTYMFDTGAFPFVVTGQHIPDDFRRIPFNGAYTELYRLPSDNYEEMLARLDAYEGVPYLYKRSYYLINGYRSVNPRKTIHEPRLLIYYTWNRDIEEQHVPVPCGDWLKYKDGDDPFYKVRNDSQLDVGGDDPLRQRPERFRARVRLRDLERRAFDEAFIEEVPDIDEDFDDEDNEIME